MKRIISLALCAILIFTFVSCTNLESTEEEQITVSTISGSDGTGKYSISYEMMRYAVLNALDDHIAAGGKAFTSELMATDEGKALNDEIMKKANESLKSIYAVFALGEKYEVARDNPAISALVDANLEEQRAGYGSDREYKKALEENHMTMAVARVMLEFEAVYDEVYNKMLEVGDIETDPDSLKDIFMSDDFVRVKELLFSAEKHSLDECRTLCEDALAEISAGADFDEYVQENGESLFMFNNDDGYYICRGIWDETLEDTVFSLDIGEISDIVVIEDGARLFKREEKSEEFIDSHIEDMTDTYTEGTFRRLIEDQISLMNIEHAANFEGTTVLDIAEEGK